MSRPTPEKDNPLEPTVQEKIAHQILKKEGFFNNPLYDVMPKLELEIVYPFNRQYSMSAAKVCWVNSVACNLLYHIISTIEIYFVIELSGGPIRAGGCKR